jgi:hypothetical protein
VVDGNLVNHNKPMRAHRLLCMHYAPMSGVHLHTGSRFSVACRLPVNDIPDCIPFGNIFRLEILFSRKARVLELICVGTTEKRRTSFFCAKVNFKSVPS